MPDTTRSSHSGESLQVFGENILRGPLLDTDKATSVVIRGADGTPMFIVAKITDQTWVVSKEDDEDFDEVLGRFGIEK